MEALSTALRGLDHGPRLVALEVDVVKSREYRKEPPSSLSGGEFGRKNAWGWGEFWAPGPTPARMTLISQDLWTNSGEQ